MVIAVEVKRNSHPLSQTLEIERRGSSSSGTRRALGGEVTAKGSRAVPWCVDRMTKRSAILTYTYLGLGSVTSEGCGDIVWEHPVSASHSEALLAKADAVDGSSMR